MLFRNRFIRGLFSNYAGLPFGIYILFIARVINRFGGFVHAFLALFLSSYLGMGEAEMGSYVLFAGAAGFLGSLIGGPLGDRFSRKKVYLAAQAISAFLFLPCAWFAYTGDYTQIPFYLIASSFFSAVVRPVNTAMVTDMVEEEDRKRAFSLLYLGINFGVAAAPIVAAFLLNHYLVWFFLGDAITTIIAVFLVGFLVKERKITQEEMDALGESHSEAQEKSNLLVAFIKRPVLMIFVLFSVIASMMYAQVGFAYPLLLKEIYGKELGTQFYGVLSSFNAIVVILMTSLIHYATQKVRPIYNIATATILYAVGMGMMAFISSRNLFFLSTFIWTVGEIQAVTNQNVYLMRHTPINYRSRFLATISIITSVGYVASPKIGGILIEAYGQSFLWMMVAIGGIIATVGFLMIGLYERRKEESI